MLLTNSASIQDHGAITVHQVTSTSILSFERLNQINDDLSESSELFTSTSMGSSGDVLTSSEDDSQILEQFLGPIRDPLSTTISMTVIYGIIFVTGVIGNLSTCIVIKRNKYMHTTVNYYLFSLAISDLLLLNFGLPIELYMLWRKYPYIFGKYFCVFRAFISETSTNASILTITAFTVERYLAICHPLRAHTMSQLSRAIKVILIVWAISASAAIPMAYPFDIVYRVKRKNEDYIKESGLCEPKIIPYMFELGAFLFFVLPMLLISILYILIGLRIRRTSSIASRNDSTGDRSPSEIGKTQATQTNGSREAPTTGTPIVSQNSYRAHWDKRRVIVRMLVAVVASFFICWSPFHAQRVMAVYVTQDSSMSVVTTYTVLTHVSGITYYLTATINPILYQLLSLKFRLAFKDTFGFWPPLLKPAHIPDLTVTSTYAGLGSTSLEPPSIKGSFGVKRYLSSNGSLSNMPSPAILRGQAFFSDQISEPKSP